ncbi:LTA synthase family protein [Pelistega ratti]|uniref:LTA synthase family protein n=1 Tax=Pelistega ratti TaxID=2652177 RepID=UPI00135C362E|nr:LTA synthase family protein [Pelistega ratti]
MMLLIPIIGIFIYQGILLSLNRYAMVKTFVPHEIVTEQSVAMKRMYLLGMRFDLKILSILIGLPLFLVTVCLSMMGGQWIEQYLSTIALGLAIIVFLLCLLVNGVVVTNYYYFKTYQNHYDIFMFGLVEDDTKAVIKNIIDDYPVIRLLIGIVISALLPAIFLYNSVYYQIFAIENSWLQVLVGLAAFMLWILLARGTLRSRPLGIGHAQVCSVGVINKMVPNGLTAMGWAFMARKLDISFKEVTEEEGMVLLAKMGVDKRFYAQTEQNEYLAENRPHVVFALMESMGSNIWVYDDPIHNDLLGSLRPFTEKSFLFKRFCAEYNGTAPSLANIFFHSHVQNISQSVAQDKSLAETPFKVYKAKGYKTVFITAGNIMWRNLSNYLPLQGVDRVYDQNDIMDLFPEAKETLSYWGIADEYGFKLIEKLLQESQEPLFISFLSITNHPPYTVPASYTVKKINAECLQQRYGKDNHERAAMLGTYQYACNALGQFMQKISEHQVLGDKTIIAATGDHHVRNVFVDNPKEGFLSKAVPFLLHLPDSLKATLNIHFDKERIGSHKDIMPTLYAVSLSQATYWHACGQNLLGSKEQTAFAFASSVGACYADKEGVVDTSVQPFIMHQWDGDSLYLKREDNLVPVDSQEKINAYQDFLVWQTNYLVMQATREVKV